MDADRNGKTLALEMFGIVKDFPGVRALDQADFAAETGEIHGLVGENGAGKSTLIKILAGIYQRDAGHIRISGRSYETLTPRIVENAGVQFIHQERYLVPHFTVAESLYLGHELVGAPMPLLRTREMQRRAEQFMAAAVGVPLPGDALIRNLSVAQAQLVQIGKALRAKPSIIVLDEPTAPLARREVDRLFQTLQKLRQDGITIVYISHYLQEICEICNRVTVLQNGRHVATLPASSTSPEELVGLMVGRDLGEMFPRRACTPGAPLLEVQGLRRRKVFEDITFTLRGGEVLGVTGLLGSGCEGLADTLFGLVPYHDGAICFKGQPVKTLSPVKAVRNRLALVPRDRRQRGIVISMGVSDNINLASLDKVNHRGFVDRKKARARAVQMMSNLDIRAPGPEAILRYLSGGNQQKVVVGRWLGSDAEIYLLDEPTVGIDVGAKAEIYGLVNRLVENGAGVLLVSSDIPELLAMSDRVMIMYRGRVIKECRASEVTADEVLSWATGGQQDT